MEAKNGSGLMIANAVDHFRETNKIHSKKKHRERLNCVTNIRCLCILTYSLSLWCSSLLLANECNSTNRISFNFNSTQIYSILPHFVFGARSITFSTRLRMHLPLAFFGRIGGAKVTEHCNKPQPCFIMIIPCKTTQIAPRLNEEWHPPGKAFSRIVRPLLG